MINNGFEVSVYDQNALRTPLNSMLRGISASGPYDVIAVGDRVSYGYAAPRGKVLIPVIGGPFSAGVTGAMACPHDQPGCLRDVLVRATPAAETWDSAKQPGGGPPPDQPARITFSKPNFSFA